MKQNKTAIFVNCLDPIFFNQADKQSCFATVDEGSSLGRFARKNFPKSNLIFFKMAVKKGKDDLLSVLSQPDLLKSWRQNQISHFVVPHRLCRPILSWAGKNNFKLVGPSAKQQRLENKIYFDGLLKRHQLPSPAAFNKNNLSAPGRPKIWVVQQQESYGMFGTRFVTDIAAVKKLALPKASDRKLLIREYLPGISLGVSIFINRAGSHFFSALRRQCFDYQNGLPRYFLGIQWLPKDFFSPAVNKRISLILQQLVKVLKQEGFYGLANIDFIISRGQPYILECNPRLSSATPQIFSVPGITNCAQPWQFYLKTYYHQAAGSTITASQLPPSNYQGCLLDVDSIKKETVKHILPLGVYRWRGRKLIFVSDSIKDYNKDRNNLFLYHELKSDLKSLPAGSTLGTFISHQPLFNFKTGSLNVLGRKIFNYYQKAILT